MLALFPSQLRSSAVNKSWLHICHILDELRLSPSAHSCTCLSRMRVYAPCTCLRLDLNAFVTTQPWLPRPTCLSGVLVVQTVARFLYGYRVGVVYTAKSGSCFIACGSMATRGDKRNRASEFLHRCDTVIIEIRGMCRLAPPSALMKEAETTCVMSNQ